MNLTRKKMFWLCSFNIITLFLCFNACMNITTAINLLLIFQICKNNIFLTFNTGAWRVPGAGPVLFGRGMLSINPKTLRSLSSEIRRDNRGSVPDILYLEHTYRYTHKSAAFNLSRTTTYFEYPDYKKPLLWHAGVFYNHCPAESDSQIHWLQDVKWWLFLLTCHFPITSCHTQKMYINDITWQLFLQE